MGNGLKMICKAFGGLRVRINGVSKTYLWDYKRDCPVDEDELKRLKKEERLARIAASERAKWEAVQQSLFSECAECGAKMVNGVCQSAICKERLL